MEKSRKDIPNELIFLIAGLIVIFLSFIGVSDAVSPFMASLFTPLVEPSVKAGNNITVAVDSISKINEIRRERNDLQEENAVLKAENSTVSILKDELELLRKELELDSAQGSLLVKGTVLSNRDEEQTHLLVLDRGDKDGVKEGSIARIGNFYIGLIQDVTSYRSNVLLPTYGESYLEVVILPKQEDIMNLDYEEIGLLLKEREKQIWKGVAIGRDTGIVVENIEANALIAEGDHVIVSDSDVGKLLYLGDLGQINIDPSDVDLTVNVILPINYQNLFNLIVEVEE